MKNLFTLVQEKRNQKGVFNSVCKSFENKKDLDNLLKFFSNSEGLYLVQHREDADLSGSSLEVFSFRSIDQDGNLGEELGEKVLQITKEEKTLS